jgi:hypothetical protein
MGVNRFTNKFGGRIMKKMSVLVVSAMMILVVGCSKDLKVTVKDNLEVEYGDKLDNSILFDKEQSDEGIAVKEVKNFDAKKTGEQEITVIFTNADEKTKEETLKVTVKDTKKPVIKLKKEKVEITAGDKFDAASNIESVKDPVDGDIKKSEDKKLTKNGYIITSDVNIKKAGSYTVKVTAYDVNGNKAESSYKVTVKKKPQEQTPTQNNNQTSSNNSYSNNQGNTSYSKPTSGSTSSTKKPSSGSSNNSGSSSGQATNKPHKHWGPAVEGMYFDSGDELDEWAMNYIIEQGDKGNIIGAAWGVSECSCGKLYINMFY